MNFYLSEEQIQKLKTLCLTTLIAFVVSVFTIITGYRLVIEPMLQEYGVVPQAVGALGNVPYNVSALPMRCKQSGINCVEIWNGSDLSLYADGGSTRKVFMDGATGNATFAGTVTVTNLVSQTVGYELGNGTVGAPSLTFASDTDTGLYRLGANDLGFTTNGTRAMDLSSNSINAALPVVHAAGTVSLPSITFTGDPDSGLYAIGANNIGLATGGAKIFDCNASGCTMQGTIKGAAEGNVVINLRHEVTAAEINTGHTLVTVPTGRQFRLVSAEATATGGTCTTSTSVDLIVGANHLAVFTTANLVQSTMLKAGVSTGAAVLADAASFTAQTAATNLTVGKVGDATAGCTSVVFNISYVLE